MKKRDFYIFFLLMLLVAYAAYYRNQHFSKGKNQQPESKIINTSQQSGMIQTSPPSIPENVEESKHKKIKPSRKTATKNQS